MLIFAVTFTLVLAFLIAGYVAFNTVRARIVTLDNRDIATLTRRYANAGQYVGGRNDIGVN